MPVGTPRLEFACAPLCDGVSPKLVATLMGEVLECLVLEHCFLLPHKLVQVSKSQVK